ncbi:phosphoadenosine phosphosulfate reductase [Tenacibaculum phage PTm1]|uniref:Phosphoadenosine phosphosulfate reductase n=2 Tax=Shirahamavirus PTm1 TaxID=2846435 RepID=A0A5S9C0Z6_9CAUD|nr:phosphoadenosine phosphosulfate reductase [Tenacibaculum phage PTm1]BBI90503.1 phosphoadenosine phosphosulfate reductase [Tenacibaculum phage PTm1]BBI90811.1 phosphoadenosine phosphosulfate reductase [Tenacibaculum phage PTm5]
MAKENKSDEYEMVFVFANTGQENEETLEFVNKCDEEYNLNVVWIEAKTIWGVRAYGKKYYFNELMDYERFLNNFYIHEFDSVEFYKNKICKETKQKIPQYRKCIEAIRAGTRHTVVDYKTADRGGGVFERMIQKYMIPNKQNMICTRELKERPIRSYARSIGWLNGTYETAIGIRVDEIDRISSERLKNKLIYPLVNMKPMTKKNVNYFWSLQNFRLNLKGYQGNCKTCWKKSFRKLGTIAKETPKFYDFFGEMERKYGHFVSEGRKSAKTLEVPLRFFRSGYTVDMVLDIPNDTNFKDAFDDSVEYDETLTDGTLLDISNGCSESCEVF